MIKSITTKSAKRMFVARVLEQLGHEVPNDEAMRKVLIQASRSFKHDNGMSPDPDVSLSLVALPGIQFKENK